MGGTCCGQKSQKPSVQQPKSIAEPSPKHAPQKPEQPSQKPVEPPPDIVQLPPDPVQPPPGPVQLPSEPVQALPKPVQPPSGPGIKPRPINPSDIIAEDEIELQICSLSKKLDITVRVPSSLKCKDLYQQVRQSTDKEFLLGYKGRILDEDHKEIEALGISSNAELECYFKP